MSYDLRKPAMPRTLRDALEDILAEYGLRHCLIKTFDQLNRQALIFGWNDYAEKLLCRKACRELDIDML